jgi:hypothetical protein
LAIPGPGLSSSIGTSSRCPIPCYPDGFRFRTADEAGPEAAVQAHVDARAPSTYTAEGYEGVRKTASCRDDLHVLAEAPGGTMAASTIT